MVDLFQFKNIYAVKLEMMRLTEDVALQCECVSYVTLPGTSEGIVVGISICLERDWISNSSPLSRP